MCYKMWIMEQAIILSKQLEQLDFWLFRLLKIDLPNYMWTINDINFLLRLDQLMDYDLILQWWLWFRIKKLFEKNPELLELHCDPYELFIDAWYLDKNLDIIKI